MLEYLFLFARHCKHLIDGLKDYSENYQSSDEWIRIGLLAYN